MDRLSEDARRGEDDGLRVLFLGEGDRTRIVPEPTRAIVSGGAGLVPVIAASHIGRDGNWRCVRFCLSVAGIQLALLQFARNSTRSACLGYSEGKR